jgi:hypothetical protein
MRQAAMLVVGIFATVLVIGAGAARAQEEAVPVNKIPKAVMDSLIARFPKARIDKCTRAKEGGDIVYDIEFTQQSGRKGEADIREAGTYINFEKQIDAKSLSRTVRGAVEQRYPKSTLKEVMEETEVKGRNERLSAYEVVLVTADRKNVEVRVSPDGRILEDTGETQAKK